MSDSIADQFLRAALVPREHSFNSGTLDRANAVFAKHPELPSESVYVAAALADRAAVARHLARDPSLATVKGGVYGWDALTTCVFSRFLRLDADRSDAFVATATLLLDAGAPVHTGFYEKDDDPSSMFESVIYGAAGNAQHAAMTRLLLERGADPNDGETPYHTPETYDNRAMTVVVESGKLTADSLAIMLLRKADWHDTEGMRYLLEHGADPNLLTMWGWTALHQAVRRDNDLSAVTVLLDHGGDALRTDAANRTDAWRIAARRGRADLLAEFSRRGVAPVESKIDALITACARDDNSSSQSLLTVDPAAATVLLQSGGTLLAEFAGNGNAAGLGHLLKLGVPVNAPYIAGDGYFEIPAGSRALHVATWKGRPEAVALLIARGANVNEADANGRTPLMLAIRACVDSHWTWRRTPDVVRMLLRAGAVTTGVSKPTGYDAIDELL